MSDFKERFEDEMLQAQQETFMSPEYRRKKLMMYLIRTLIAVAIFYFLWDQSWIKWALYVYIPLNLLSLLSILLWPYIIKRKMQRTRQRIEELEALSDEEE